MRELFYKALTTLSRIFGTWLFVLISRGIAAGYFLLLPKRAMLSVRFYRALFPNRHWSYHVGCAWRQFQNFTSVFLDRHLLHDNGAITYTFEGREYLLQALAQGQGGILLMSHMGNWEVGARLLRRNIPELRLMLFMGRHAQEQIKQLQKEDLTASGIRIVAVDQQESSPLDLIEAVGFLKTGGFVSMAGDIVWRPDQRVVATRFLGHTVQLPEAPHMLALVAKAPLFIFFASIQGARKYHFCVSPPIQMSAGSRAQRAPAIQRSAQAYADHLERHLRRSPFEWYHFKPFLGPRIEDGAGARKK